MEGIGYSERFCCRHCKGWVIEVMTDEGTPVYLDAVPSPFGTIAVVKARAVVLSGEHLHVFRSQSVKLYTPHSATCRKPAGELPTRGQDA